MSNVAYIGPLHDLKKLVMEKTMVLLATTSLDTEQDRYGFMTLVLDECATSKEIQKKLTDVVNSFNDGMVDSQAMGVIPGILKSYLDLLQSDNAKKIIKEVKV